MNVGFNKAAFLTAYRNHLIAGYCWAADTAKLARYMDSVQNTIESGHNTWNHDGEKVILAWRNIGGKGKPTLKALRALPAA